MIDPGAQQLLVAFETAFQSKVTIPILLLDVILMFCLGCVRSRKPRLGALDGATIQNGVGCLSKPNKLNIENH